MAVSRLAQAAVPLSASFSSAITCRKRREIFLGLSSSCHSSNAVVACTYSNFYSGI